MRLPLYLTVLTIATAGIVYELLAGAIATTVLGNSLRQYSLTIGVYLFAMGLGAYLSKYLKARLCERFVDLQFATGLIGGSQGVVLFLAYGRSELFAVALYATLTLIGTLVGLEIPLLMRVLKEELDFSELVAKVLAFDYLGSLLGSAVFSVVLVEMLAMPLERIGLMFGVLNCLTGLLGTWVLAPSIHPTRRLQLRLRGAFGLAALLCVGLYSTQLRVMGEQGLYGERVILAQHSAHQRIVLTSDGTHLQMFLDGNLQWSSSDEYRYHEALVHPALALHPQAKRALVLGGGDGLAVRELRRYAHLQFIQLVDLDPAVTRIARQVPAVAALNGQAFQDPRVHVVHDDAMVFLREFEGEPFDVIFADFPDPNNYALGKLYTTHFYELVRQAMAERAVLAVQSTSPLYARESYWCIEHSMRAAGLFTAPYHVPVPSFGEWGYVLAQAQTFAPPTQLAVENLRYLNDGALPSLFTFAADIGPVDTAVNRLHHQTLVRYYNRAEFP